MKIWDAMNGKELLSLDGHLDNVRAIAWSSDGRQLASADKSTLKLWDATAAYDMQQHSKPAP